MIDNLEDSRSSSKSVWMQFVDQLLILNRLGCREIVAEIPLDEISETLLIPALEHIGAEWSEGRLSLAQVYMSGRICEDLLNTLYVEGSTEEGATSKVAIVTLHDYHLLGKRLVRSVLLAAGVHHVDFGRLDKESLIERVMEDEVELLLISTLMLRSAHMVEDVTKGLENLGAPTKVAVGGAPFRFDDSLWKLVGADAYGQTASQAVEIVKRYIGGGL